MHLKQSIGEYFQYSYKTKYMDVLQVIEISQNRKKYYCKKIRKIQNRMNGNQVIKSHTQITGDILILLRYNSPTYCDHMLYQWLATGSFPPE